MNATKSVDKVTESLGSLRALLVVCILSTLWAVVGAFIPDGRWLNTTFQVATTTAISFVTWWMVHAIEFTQNRDDRANQTKMDAQARVLVALAHQQNYWLTNEEQQWVNELERLIAIEDESEDVIKSEQQKVRREPKA